MSKQKRYTLKFLFLLAMLGPGSAGATPTIAEMISQMCKNPQAFSHFQSFSKNPSLAPALVQVLQDVNQAKCWSNASQVLSMMGPDAKKILPEILTLVKESSTNLSGPMRELQQAFAISALPPLSGQDAMDSIQTLMALMASGSASASMKDLSASALINKFSAIDSYEMLLALAKKSESYANQQLSQADIQRILYRLRAQSHVEATKWLAIFNRELKRLNGSTY